ncbi:MAG: hypothetical protein APF83_01205 [Lutibacter sp. BRH_c52]|nr:MAG: hypothetical protein APF83_01205 [Lutibacter sp. BRH_c52]
MKLTSKGTLSNDVKSKFIRACERLDASIFEPYIDEDQYFQDLDKYRFLQSLKDEFDRVKGMGIESTVLIKGICEGCYSGQDSYQFYGKNVIPEFSYVIHKKDGDVSDILMCNSSSGALVVKAEIIANYDFWK